MKKYFVLEYFKKIIRKLKHNYVFFMFFFGAWFILRVGKKPSRIAYPCQQAFLAQATPTLQNALTPFLAIVSVTSRSFIKNVITKKNFTIFLVLATLFFAGGFYFDKYVDLEKTFFSNKYDFSLNQMAPLTGMTLTGFSVIENYPNRVVSVHDSDSTNWDFGLCGYGSCAYYYGDNAYVNQAVVDNMIDRGLMELSGTTTISDAWSEILSNYVPGQKIAIKVNFNDAIMGGGVQGYGDDDAYVDAIPQPINSVIRGLKLIGVQEEDIWVYDASRYITDRFRNRISYPNVVYFDHYGTAPGVYLATFDSPDPSAQIDFLGSGYGGSHKVSDVLVNADYLIDMPILKLHGPSKAGVTLSLKNHLGSINGFYSGGHSMHNYFYLGGINYDPNSNPIVDINANTHIKDKTILIVGEGLYGTVGTNNARPVGWSSFGGDSPNILFFGVDPIAVDSVMYDYLLREPSNALPVSAEEVYIVAAVADLGIHERWNNDIDREYQNIDYIEMDFDILLNCSEQDGYICDFDESCEGVWLDASDTGSCCSIPCTNLGLSPLVNYIQCNNGGGWGDCSNIQYNSMLQEVRVNCTDDDGYITNATFKFENLQDNKIFFDNITTSNVGDYWTLNNIDFLIQDSGNFSLTATCIDNDSLTDVGIVEWFIPWGTLSVEQVYPTINLTVNNGEIFPFTTRAICNGGECGNITAILDPMIMLQDADTENLNDDSAFDSGSATGPRVYAVQNEQYQPFVIMFNISSIPTGQTIDDAVVCVYDSNTNPVSNPTNVTEYDNNYWNEEDGVANITDFPVGATLDTFARDGSVEWHCANVTTWVKSEYDDGDDNVSIAFVWTYSNPNSYWNVYSKEYTGDRLLRPYLNISYSPQQALITEEWGSAVNSDHLGTIEDTFLSIIDINLANATTLNTYTWPDYMIANAIVIKWNLSDIPSTATIINATLYLYQYRARGYFYTMPVHKIINYNPVINLTTGLTYDGINNWTETFCCGDPPIYHLAQADIDPVESSITTDNITMGYKSWSVTNMVQDWVSDISTNYGMLVNSDPFRIKDWSRYFNTSEDPNTNVRPKLIITYDAGGGVIAKGQVSTIPGATPFYTTDPNPRNPDNTVCLDDMKGGDSCVTTWQVNATGDKGTYEFFVTYEPTQYPINTNETEHVNIIITTCALPYDIEPCDIITNEELGNAVDAWFRGNIGISSLVQHVDVWRS